MFFSSKPTVSIDEAKIDELLSRGVAEAIPTTGSLKKLLMGGKKLRIKLGVDPTGENIHLGNTVPLLKLRDFQELGHQVVFIVGDFTAVIGDTSDKESERPMLADDAIKKNMATWKTQVGKVLDLSKTEFRKNSEWLGKLTYREIGEHANIFSVADFIARDNIKRRLNVGKRVSLREVLYPLMQGYDSVAVKADVELGASDQRFNVLAGRPLQEHFGQTPQHCLLFSLMAGTDGEKMSKSRGNVINITDTPDDMFGRAMSMKDEVVKDFFVSATRVPLSKVEEILMKHPKEAKMALAKELVRMYHGEKAAHAALENFEKTFSKGEVPEGTLEISVEGALKVSDLVRAGVVASNTEANRLLKDGAIRIAGSDEKVVDLATIQAGTVLRIGKHRFLKIVK